MGRHALIFGASGIQGWAVTNQLLNGYPDPESFEKITALTHRPIQGRTLWPETSKLRLVSGIDLQRDDLEQQLVARVTDIATVTTVFFLAYTFNPDQDQEVATNLKILSNAITAVEALSEKLEFVVLATGTKAYGVHLIDEFPFRHQVPLTEELPSIPEPHRSKLFYCAQTDWLAGHSRDRAWTYCELRPDVIVGFVPNGNAYCIAQLLAKFLALYREVNGKGAICPLPGTLGSWDCLSNDSGQDTIARFAIHAALHPEQCGAGQAFNVASHRMPLSWSERWPILCNFFDLKGAPPPTGEGFLASQFLADHRDEWAELEASHGLVGAEETRSVHMLGHGILACMKFDRQLSLERMHQAWAHGGKPEESTTEEIWWTAFRRFRDAKIIP
ncbi:hypothetical protein CKM354_000126100 [Cercospora kikuchii]|uniref:PRISE-like Rossmann-fold domain-containing protein n=1 Tax=Cercospora kikuchii TaxID=84275 RepID=A0A9P3CFP3_9PEZI|nr:uncharacterized protein CKM354_000126100 [Cercospora kikuchii]GIZ37828.1 hypothetical protein CKM354_000126100 [Cercospora kikuchii]